MLAESVGPLVDAHDLVALDLDGVVYVGQEVVPHAAEELARARGAGIRLAFVTNNASRTPDHVAAHLRSLQIVVEADDVVTSAQAAAEVLRERLPSGSRVYVIGGVGLEVALAAVGLVPVFDGADVDAVVQGYGPDMPWKRVVSGAILVRGGCLWVASNTDATIPTEQGVGPGNGALVDLVARFSGKTPLIAGKPSPPLLLATRARFGAERPLFVGDRLDTDMAGAANVGWPSLLVRTGVTGLRELVDAPAGQRPSFMSADLRGLHVSHARPKAEGPAWVLGGWRAYVDAGDHLRVDGSGTDDDWWRCGATAAWVHRDAGTTASLLSVSELRPPR